MPPSPVARTGRRLVATTAAVIGLVVGVALLVEGPTQPALSALLRATGASSLFLFLVTFSASSINELWRGPTGKWLLAHRRYLGNCFAISHTIHLALIGTRLAAHTDVVVGERTITSLIPGATAYAFLFAMVITSFDGPARALGRTRWKLLHTLGMYVIWGLFVGAYSGGLRRDPLYAAPIAALAGAVALRAAARWRAMRRRAARTRRESDAERS